MKQEEAFHSDMGQGWLDNDWNSLHRLKHFLIGSGVLHVAALVYFLSNPAWLDIKEETRSVSDPVLTHIPSHIVDQILEPALSAPPSRPRPKPEPVQEVKPETQPPVVRSDPSPTRRDEVKDPLPKTPHKIKISTRVVQPSTPAKVPPRPGVDPNQTRANAMNKALERLDQRLSSTTEVNMSGVASVAMASYASVVKTIYNRSWVAPPELEDDRATVRAEIVILRNGNVKSSRIISKSGISVLDQSVEKTLNAVRFVQAFPSGVEDLERTFVINFNLKSKGIL